MGPSTVYIRQHSEEPGQSANIDYLVFILNKQKKGFSIEQNLLNVNKKRILTWLYALSAISHLNKHNNFVLSN